MTAERPAPTTSFAVAPPREADVYQMLAYARAYRAQRWWSAIPGTRTCQTARRCGTSSPTSKAWLPHQASRHPETPSPHPQPPQPTRVAPRIDHHVLPPSPHIRHRRAADEHETTRRHYGPPGWGAPGTCRRPRRGWCARRSPPLARSAAARTPQGGGVQGRPSGESSSSRFIPNGAPVCGETSRSRNTLRACSTSSPGSTGCRAPSCSC